MSRGQLRIIGGAGPCLSAYLYDCESFGGVSLKEDSESLDKIVENILSHEGIDGVVLGCTELPVLHDRYSLRTSCQLFDSIDIIVQHIGKVECLKS